MSASSSTSSIIDSLSPVRGLDDANQGGYYMAAMRDQDQSKEDAIQLCRWLFPDIDAESLDMIEEPMSAKYDMWYITIPPGSRDHPEGDYVLRLARRGAPDDHACHYAMLRWLSGCDHIPAPLLLKNGLAADNPVKRSFSIETRLSGTPMSVVYHSLNHRQKLSFARSFGRVVHEMREKQAWSFGRLNPELCHSRPDPLVQFPTTIAPGKCVDVAAEAAIFQRVPAFLTELCYRWGEHGRDQLRPFVELIRDLDDLEVFGQLGVGYLVHRRLNPDNIFIMIPNEEEVIIGGILGWDKSCFLPKFMACEAPTWVWQQEDAFSSDTKCLGEPELTDPRQREIKRAFEEGACQKSCKEAYSQEHFFLRQLTNTLLDGIHDGFGEAVAMQLLEFSQSVRSHAIRKQKERLRAQSGMVKDSVARKGRSKEVRDGMVTTLWLPVPFSSLTLSQCVRHLMLGFAIGLSSTWIFPGSFVPIIRLPSFFQGRLSSVLNWKAA